MASAVDERDQAILNVATDRFERRLSEEAAKLRVEMGAFRDELRGEIHALRIGMQDLRTDMNGLRNEMHGLRVELRADLKAAIADTRSELLKWSFLFWVGQVAAITGLVTLVR